MFGLRAEIVSTGCCGMGGGGGGGSFGYRHSELSKKIFQNNVRLPAVAGKPSPLLVSGTSCRHQFRDLSSTEPLHLAQFLSWDVLVGTQGGGTSVVTSKHE